MLRLGPIASGFEKRLLGALATANAQIALSALRVSTGKKYNFPKDGPSQFLQIAALEREQSAVQAAAQRVDAAANIGSQLQTNLDSVIAQLDNIRGLLAEDVNQSLTAAQRAENQLEIDAALQQITTLAHTPIGGKNILDGGSNYLVTGQSPSTVQRAQVYSLNGETTISGSVTTAATRGTLTYTGAAGLVTATATFTLTGKLGGATISVSLGETLSSAATKINNASYATGVTASVSGSTLTFTTVDYGTQSTAAVNVTSGTFNVAGTGRGTNAVVTLNGTVMPNVDGNHIVYARNGTHVQLDLKAAYTGAISALTFSDSPTLKFSLGTGTEQTVLGLRGVLLETLGGNSGTLDQLASGSTLDGLGTVTAQAIRVVDEALGQLTILSGQVNGFADSTIDASAELLSDWDGNLTTTLTGINGVDDDEEDLAISRSQNLAANALASLSILQDQQTAVVALIQRMAGLI